MTAQILPIQSPLRQLEADLRPMFENAEAMLRQSEIDAASGKPSLSEADCRGVAEDVSLQAYALCGQLGLCPLIDMVPFWMRVAVFFPRVSEGVMAVWKEQQATGRAVASEANP